MNPPRCDDLDYIHFLTAAQKVFTCTEAARCAPEGARWPTRPSPARGKGGPPTQRRCGGKPRPSGLLPWIRPMPSRWSGWPFTGAVSGAGNRPGDPALDPGAGPPQAGWGPGQGPAPPRDATDCPWAGLQAGVCADGWLVRDCCAGLAPSDPAGEPGRAGQPTHRGGGGSAGGAGGTPEGLWVRRAGRRGTGRPMACR